MDSSFFLELERGLDLGGDLLCSVWDYLQCTETQLAKCGRASSFQPKQTKVKPCSSTECPYVQSSPVCANSCCSTTFFHVETFCTVLILYFFTFTIANVELLHRGHCQKDWGRTEGQFAGLRNEAIRRRTSDCTKCKCLIYVHKKNESEYRAIRLY